MKLTEIHMPYNHGYRNDGPKSYTSFSYPGGEKQVRLTQPALFKLAYSDEVFVVARITSGEIMELALLADAVHENFSGKSTLILPYLPYARADRRFTDGDCHGLKVFGSLIDSLGFDRVVTLDAHSRHARRLISNLTNVSPAPLVKAVLDLLPKDTVVLYPDEGASTRYGIEGVEYITASKVRDPKTGELSGFKVSENINDYKNVLIVDDICDGGGTFAGIAKEINPVINLNLYVTHGIFSKGLTPLVDFKRIFTTDSLDVRDASYGALTVIPAMGTIMEKLLPTKSELWEYATEAK